MTEINGKTKDLKNLNDLIDSNDLAGAGELGHEENPLVRPVDLNAKETDKCKLRVLVKSDPSVNIDHMIGSIKAPKGFNVEKALEEVRKREF
jgi:hypothetical protein